jgi:hypothetical protein
MNIFYLNHNPKIAAQEHVDRHVVKMILESAQLLCTAHRVLDGRIQSVTQTTAAGKQRTIKKYVHPNSNLEKILYSCTHMNHPCAIWTRDSINNYMWLYELFVALCDEYTFRYGKTHKTDLLLRDILKNTPANIAMSGATPPAQAMPEKYRNADPVIAYQEYYIHEKRKFANWTNRSCPIWFNELNYERGLNANV